MLTKLQKVHGIIHTTAAACAGIGAGFAQVPGADTVPIMTAQGGMIALIAEAHGVSITKAAATDLILTFSASVGGRAASQALLGWVPGYGNALNATTAAAITEAIGWAAHAYFTETKPDAIEPPKGPTPE